MSHIMTNIDNYTLVGLDTFSLSFYLRKKCLDLPRHNYRYIKIKVIIFNLTPNLFASVLHHVKSVNGCPGSVRPLGL